MTEQTTGQITQLRVTGQSQSLNTAQVAKDGGRKSANMILG